MEVAGLEEGKPVKMGDIHFNDKAKFKHLKMMLCVEKGMDINDHEKMELIYFGKRLPDYETPRERNLLFLGGEVYLSCKIYPSVLIRFKSEIAHLEWQEKQLAYAEYDLELDPIKDLAQRIQEKIEQNLKEPGGNHEDLKALREFKGRVDLLIDRWNERKS
jgi:hypothetical protein